MTLLVAVIGDDDTHGQVVPVRHGGDGTRTLARESQRTHNQRDRILVEREVVVAGRTEVHRIGVGDGRVERTIESDAGQTGHRNDRVLGRGARGAEADDLADLRGDGERVHHDRLRVTGRVAGGEIDRTRNVTLDNRRGRDGRTKAGRFDGDAGRVAQGVGDGLHAVRGVVAGDGDPLANRQRAGEGRGEDGGTDGHVTAVDGTRQERIADGHDGHVLVHPEVPAELAAQRGFLESLALIADLLRLGEDVQVEQGRFGQRVQHEVATVDRGAIDVHDLTQSQEVGLGVGGRHAVQGARLVREELSVLAEDDLVDEPSLGDDCRTEVFVDQRLERLRLFAVADEERRVDMLVQGNLHGIRGHVLHRDVVGVRLALSDQFGRLRHVHDIAVASQDVLEVAVNQVAADHVLDENRDGLIGPHFGDEHIHRVVVNRAETETEGIDLLHENSHL